MPHPNHSPRVGRPGFHHSLSQTAQDNLNTVDEKSAFYFSAVKRNVHGSMCMGQNSLPPRACVFHMLWRRLRCTN